MADDYVKTLRVNIRINVQANPTHLNAIAAALGRIAKSLNSVVAAVTALKGVGGVGGGVAGGGSAVVPPGQRLSAQLAQQAQNARGGVYSAGYVGGGGTVTEAGGPGRIAQLISYGQTLWFWGNRIFNTWMRMLGVTMMLGYLTRSLAGVFVNLGKTAISVFLTPAIKLFEQLIERAGELETRLARVTQLFGEKRGMQVLGALQAMTFKVPFTTSQLQNTLALGAAPTGMMQHFGWERMIKAAVNLALASKVNDPERAMQAITGVWGGRIEQLRRMIGMRGWDIPGARIGPKGGLMTEGREDQIRNVEALLKVIEERFGGLMERMQGGFQQVKSNLTDVGYQFALFFKQFSGLDAITGSMAQLVDMLRGVDDANLKAWAQTLTNAVRGAVPGFMHMLQYVPSIGDSIVSMLSNVITTVGQFLNDHAGTIATIISKITAAIPNIISVIATAVGYVLNNWNSIIDKAQTLADITAAVARGFAAIASATLYFTEKLLQTAARIATLLGETGTAAILTEIRTELEPARRMLWQQMTGWTDKAGVRHEGMITDIRTILSQTLNGLRISDADRKNAEGDFEKMLQAVYGYHGISTAGEGTGFSDNALAEIADNSDQAIAELKDMNAKLGGWTKGQVWYYDELAKYAGMAGRGSGVAYSLNVGDIMGKIEGGFINGANYAEAKIRNALIQASNGVSTYGVDERGAAALVGGY